jgi:hypothetical protein
MPPLKSTGKPYLILKSTIKAGQQKESTGKISTLYVIARTLTNIKATASPPSSTTRSWNTENGADHIHNDNELEYQPIPRPWENIKRAGNEKLISNENPMDRWKRETTRDQPWNAIGEVSSRLKGQNDENQIDKEISKEMTDVKKSRVIAA